MQLFTVGRYQHAFPSGFYFVFVFFNLALPVHHTQSVDPKCHQQVVLCGYGFVVLLHFNGFYVVYQSELSTVCTF